MFVLRSFIKLSVILVCAAGSFAGAQDYMAAKTETPELVRIIKADPIAAKLAEDSDLSGAKGTMSPIYPTTKYTQAQLSVPAKKAHKAKLAVRSVNKPMQLAYVPNVVR